MCYADFLDGYTLSQKAIEMLDNWADVVPSSTAPYKESLVKSYLAVALASLPRALGTPKLRVQLKPHKAVFCESNYAIGKLALVPESSRIMAVPETSDPPGSGLLCKTDDFDLGKSFYVMPQFASNFASVAWAIRAVDEATEANMRVQYKVSSVCVAQKPKSSSSKHNPDSSVTVELPVLVNHKAIKIGDELLVYRESMPKKPTSKRGLALDLCVSKRRA